MAYGEGSYSGWWNPCCKMKTELLPWSMRKKKNSTPREVYNWLLILTMSNSLTLTRHFTVCKIFSLKCCLEGTLAFWHILQLQNMFVKHFQSQSINLAKHFAVYKTHMSLERTLWNWEVTWWFGWYYENWNSIMTVFGHVGGWTQGLMLTGQTRYHLISPPAFSFWLFLR
jgi:hypothetical protein